MTSLAGQSSDQVALVRRTWRLFTLDVVGLLMASGLIFVTTVVAVGIVGGPLLATGLVHHTLISAALLGLAYAAIVGPLVGGLYGMLFHMVRQGSRVRARAVFGGYRRWPTLFAASLLSATAVSLTDAYQWSGPSSRYLLSALGFLVAVGVVYVLPAAVDEGADFRRAMRVTVRLLREGELWRTAVGVAVLVLADVLLEELPRVLLGHSAADTIGIPVAIVALPLVASYTICMYFRARQLDHLIDETVASGLAARSIAESTSRGRLLPKWVVATLAAVGIVVVLSIIAQAILRP